MKGICFFCGMLLSLYTGAAGAADLPLKNWQGNDKMPLVLYISGDGGLNSFTNDFCKGINQAGYTVTAINSRSYFWNKRTPEQVTAELTAYVDGVLKNRQNRQWLIIGYSFGADVTPFILNRLGNTVKTHLLRTILLAPSPTTDFVIRVSDMWGSAKKRSMDVVAEINRAAGQRIVAVLPGDDKDFPVSAVKSGSFKAVVLKGGHHFGGDTAGLVKIVAGYF
ncbi:AcvB/VirJ family lysyl-phosphatidylglycerol hydrolase [Niabella drilacis]|uniref:Virulence protein (VirJ) n=1 Tax=Niabella drilacis (strain DSM 25811 / CCM 8410 / CCUG 62505 / LMG 26954 / E90) TaxID=1285928 RepID=A0A1G7AJD6_NIADE|nr:AcvB/VirJ family lysyl-phosphatidylglycerol hydrolase [Niabella drilacis]SDE14125.1 virulence protein (VirJ) [Niabella drilacis]